MAGVKSLAKDTAIYGLSSIIGRFLNWCLVPMYTFVFPKEEYGIVTFVFSVISLVLTVLIYGMETGFFRFANHDRWRDPMQVYSTALISLATSGTVFFMLVLAFLSPITEAMKCGSHTSYIWMMALCTAIDAFSALPFSYLRYRKRAMRFAMLRLVNIAINIGFNLFFILLCPWLMQVAPATVDWFYDPGFGIGYIFLSNLIASSATLLMQIPELTGFRWQFCPRLWREMMAYSLPLLVLGVAGIMNQTIDKILLPYLATGPDVMGMLGIYGANYKIAIIMVLFIQAFRFAYEPFIFAQHRRGDKTSHAAYSDAMKYFVIMALLIFMGVMFYLDIIKYFISPRYFEGLAVVPVVMLAELFFGIFFNLSVWYKITDRTSWGAWFSLLGLSITVALNAVLVPRYGYMGCAWAAFSCYLVMMLTSYFVGRAKYPIEYPVKRIAAYTVIAAVLYCTGMYLAVTPRMWANWIIRAALIAVYLCVVCRYEHIRLSDITKPILAKIRK